MTDARCPLVREIEEDDKNSAGMYSDAGDLVSSKYWPRICAALEAAEEMAESIEQTGCGSGHGVDRYRAATRKP